MKKIKKQKKTIRNMFLSIYCVFMPNIIGVFPKNIFIKTRRYECSVNSH
jgi:hypothetical protein